MEAKKITPRLTQADYNAIHEKILNSAENLFAKKGYNGTSMNDIVKASGQSKGAIYNHFENKERLFLSLLEKQTILGLNQLRDSFTAKDTTIEKLKKVLDLTMANSTDCPNEVGRMGIEFMIAASRIKSLTSDMKDRYSTIHAFIRELIDEGIKNGEFKSDVDSKSLTSLLYATLEGLGLQYATLGIEFDSQRLKEVLLKVVFEGILN
ncbi:MAG: TetR/AcrR family transcriptional regulator [Candidatus Bathyarchaeota archaeon]|jgi:AcrR family transcriptional regulator|nr:TetR/AcrR family transcriptional regulator [Candidatus Bathyarchaeota archaeon]